MDKLEGSIVTKTTNSFSFSGQTANSVAMDFDTQELVILNDDTEIGRVGVIGFGADFAATILGTIQCDVKIKMPRPWTS